jgi:hypothetical protein
MVVSWIKTQELPTFDTESEKEMFKEELDYWGLKTIEDFEREEIQ